MLEAEELKRLRPLSMLAPGGGGKTSKEQQPSLVLGQLQIELREPLPQLALEVLRVVLELEAPHEIISKTHQVRLASTLRFEFLLKPQIERKVQIQITEHRRYGTALRRPFLGWNEDTVLHCPGLEPF